ncbi:glycoside hydrolase family 2 TIM barrel-domain containing protein [Butyrivibrio sp. VCB2006]|uniref:glycoside hydrolase family 2 TIM barrel-domain containing protein n=1 Tax=Butyrivibrio sp. VCB2006 TaxID=1280679 RepID=UPI0003FFC9B8|nr:glycoside hydrolase family 2 TIM barrel-domain containing protein [Butyrivibrio sp. VCB2006]
MKRLFVDGWKFWESGYGVGFEEAKSNVANFKDVIIPHDYMITDTENLYRDSIGWYMRSFECSDADLNKELFIIFDGIYMDSVVYINGRQAGEWKYGYSQFILRISEFVKAGTNEIVVAARCKFPNTRWYSGAGIYRNVWICDSEKTYIPENGVYVHSDKLEDGSGYKLSISTEICGPDKANTKVSYRLYDSCGKEISLEGDIARDVKEWDVTSTNLYKLQVNLFLDKDMDGEPIQTEEISVGFRNVKMDPDKGFFLNGRNMKLNGVCLHHDLGALGSAFNKSAMRRRLIQLKEMGVNAIRMTHNMYDPQVLELADEMGFLLISEAFDMWEGAKTEFDYARFFPKWHEKDVASWVRRDRNHPSVIMWSIGNEIYDTHASERGQEVTRDLKSLVEQHDPHKNARATIGSNYMPWEMAQKCADILKVAGYNYAENYYEKHHKEHPDWIIYGSETYSIVQSRGVYHFPLSVPTLSDSDEQCSSLGNSTTSWGADSIENCICKDRDMEFSMGQFIWTGYDYIGEPTPYQTKNSYFGLIDTAGFYKDAFYAWKSAWVSVEQDPFVHVFPYWDFNEGQTIDIRVCSNAPVVELFVNGKSLGKQNLTHAPHSGNKIFADYQVAYEKGEITAVAYGDSGKEIARETHKSFGDTDKFVISIDHRLDEYTDDRDNLVFAEISAIDKYGNPVENASDYVNVHVSGGTLMGLDNGDSTDYDSYQSDCRKLFNGKLLVIVQPEGNPSEVIIDVTKADFVPVRKVELVVSEGSRSLNSDKKSAVVTARIYPEDATDKTLVFKALNKNGTPTNVAKLEANGNTCVVTGIGDGSFTLRCEAYNGRDVAAVMSCIDFEISGLGAAFLDPYGFIPGSLYTSYIGVVGNGNEHGVASARGEETVITYGGIDFGIEGSDEITVPIFTLNDDAYDIEIWKGIPGEDGARLLKRAVYQKKSIWNVYQEATWKLSERLTGVQTISLKVFQKFHIKGFSFTRQLRAFTDLRALDADSIYGDTFTKAVDAVEGIGNNVTLEFDRIDFGEKGAGSVSICGRTRNAANTVHLRMVKVSENENGQESDTGEIQNLDAVGTEIKEILEFPQSSEYKEVTFEIERRKGKWDITFVFLPGSDFDFKYFRFD